MTPLVRAVLVFNWTLSQLYSDISDPTDMRVPLPNMVPSKPCDVLGVHLTLRNRRVQHTPVQIGGSTIVPLTPQLRPSVRYRTTDVNSLLSSRPQKLHMRLKLVKRCGIFSLRQLTTDWPKNI